MRNSILTVLFFTFTLGLLAANNPIENVSIIKTNEISVDINSIDATFFLEASFNELNESLEFSIAKTISYIQIFNENGELEFQLPVLSNKVKIGKSLFSQSGDYKIGFMIDGVKDVKFSQVNIR